MSLLPLILGTTALAATVAAPLSIDLTVQARATAAHDGTVVVRGIVRCSIETTVDIEVDVIEQIRRFDVAAGQSSTAVACDSAPTAWTVEVASDTDRPFSPGFATVSVRAVGFDPEYGIFAGVESFGFLHLTRSPR